MSDDLDALTPEAVAELLGCEPGDVIRMARARKLPAVRLGKTWRFPVEALRRHLNELAAEHVAEKPPRTPSPQSSPASLGLPQSKRGRPRAAPVPDLNKVR